MLDKVKIVKYIGGKGVETIYEKWQLAKNHTMKRSFATNLHFRGYPSKIIIEFTGHSTLKSFEHYLKSTIKDESSNSIKLWSNYRVLKASLIKLPYWPHISRALKEITRYNINCKTHGPTMVKMNPYFSKLISCW